MEAVEDYLALAEVAKRGTSPHFNFELFLELEARRRTIIVLPG